MTVIDVRTSRSRALGARHHESVDAIDPTEHAVEKKMRRYRSGAIARVVQALRKHHVLAEIADLVSVGPRHLRRVAAGHHRRERRGGVRRDRKSPRGGW